jgi:Tol biopolymer transport system component
LRRACAYKASPNEPPTIDIQVIGMLSSRTIVAMTALVTLATACSDDSEPPPVAPRAITPSLGRGGAGGNNGRLLFTSDRQAPGSTNFDIYSVNPDGSGLTRLTSLSSGESFGAWSPDGKRIAYYSDQYDAAEIFVMNADGSGSTRLTYSPGFDFEARWSKDGKRLVFVSARYAVDPTNPAATELELFTMNTDGTGVTRLTSDAFADVDPEWSPDGKQIVFGSNRADPLHVDLFTMHADGTNITQLTTGGEYRFPSWAPGGSRSSVWARPVRARAST